MDLRHSVGLFRVERDSAKAIRLYDDEESLRVAHELFVKPELVHAGLLKELRKPEYKERMVKTNTLFVKEIISGSVNEDNHIIQAINAVEELDKVCNTLTKRIREWYGYYYPELEHSISDNQTFIKRILEHTKDELMLERNDTISMGPDISPTDLDAILAFARQVDDLYTQREKLILYIDNIMMRYCPNVYILTGGLIGAKLLEKAKSLRHMAWLPSSTIQLLGAEKALFRHLRNKKIRPPKHGLILSHPYLMDAKRDKKGTAARLFAAKISIAAKVDYFKGEFIGDQLKEDLEKQLKR